MTEQQPIIAPEKAIAPKVEEKPPVAAPAAANGSKPEPHFDVEDLPYTKGEWFYDGLQFTFGKVAIIAATAAFGFVARYGKDSYGGIPNYLKIFQNAFHKGLLKNPVFSFGGKGEVMERLAGAAASTMVLFHGGNAFAPFMKWMENNRENIANWYNRRWGKPVDVEIAHERLKDEPKQTWNDVFKGRLVAWGTVFSAFMIADMVLGKGKLFGKGRADKYRFDQYEEAFGRWLTGFTKKGKALWETPLAKELTAEQKQNKVYQFGKITGLDFYATNLAIIIWSMTSRSSAKKRQIKAREAEKLIHDYVEQNVDSPVPATEEHPAPADMAPVVAMETATPAEEPKKHTDKIKPCHPCAINNHKKAASHGEHIAAQRHIEGPDAAMMAV